MLEQRGTRIGSRQRGAVSEKRTGTSGAVGALENAAVLVLAARAADDRMLIERLIGKVRREDPISRRFGPAGHAAATGAELPSDRVQLGELRLGDA